MTAGIEQLMQYVLRHGGSSSQIIRCQIIIIVRFHAMEETMKVRQEQIALIFRRRSRHGLQNGGIEWYNGTMVIQIQCNAANGVSLCAY